MATKDCVVVGPMRVTSQCRGLSSPARVGTLARNSKDTEHVIEIENGSMLPYDITVHTHLPDSPPVNPGGNTSVEFAQGSLAKALDWTASAVSLTGGDTHLATATLHCVAANPGAVRLNSPTVEYRTGAGVNWETDATATKILSISLKIT